MISPKPDHRSATFELLSNNPSVDQIIDHLVDMRGYYFHGNTKRKGAWEPHEQSSAECLALLAIGVSAKIAFDAAASMFSPELDKRHFEVAMSAGAEIVLNVKFRYKEPAEQIDRKGQINIRMPGTKVTHRASVAAAQQFLQHFQHQQPASALIEAGCTVAGTDNQIFELRFNGSDHASEDTSLS